MNLSTFSINCRGKLLQLDEPKIMGIINLTPDSFFDGGVYADENAVLKKIDQMLLDGADIIDIGAISSKPNSVIVDEATERERLLPILEKIVNNFPEAILSIDTFRSSVAKDCLAIGVHIINDIFAGSFDDNLFKVVAEYKAPIVLMHMQGTPENMQLNPTYNNIIAEFLDFFSERIKIAKQQGINDVIVDVGFGFGKTIEDNFKLLKNLSNFNLLQHPLLVGISRKSMIYKTINATAQEALNGTTFLHAFALQQGAKLLRVHDVREAKECIKLYKQLIQIE